MSEESEDYELLFKSIKEAHEYREALLRRSQGVCSIRLSSDKPDDSVKARLADENEIPGGGRIVYSGQNTAAVSWQRQDSKSRYDTYIPHRESDEPNKFGLRNTRVAFGSEECIYYDVLDRSAYINVPPSKVFNLTGIATRFDITSLYEFSGESIPDYLRTFKDSDPVPEIVPINLGVGSGLRLIFTKRVEKNNVLLDERIAKLDFIPAMGYSLVSAEFVVRKFVDGEVASLARDTYFAQYAEAEEFPGVWLIKYMEAAQARGHPNESIEVTVNEISLGIEVPPEAFTFEGLGVPDGTIVTDKRMGKSVRSMYLDGELIPLSDEYAKELILQNVRTPEKVEALKEVPEFAQRALESSLEGQDDNPPRRQAPAPIASRTLALADTGQAVKERFRHTWAFGAFFALVCVVIIWALLLIRKSRERDV